MALLLKPASPTPSNTGSLRAFHRDTEKGTKGHREGHIYGALFIGRITLSMAYMVHYSLGGSHWAWHIWCTIHSEDHIEHGIHGALFIERITLSMAYMVHYSFGGSHWAWHTWCTIHWEDHIEHGIHGALFIGRITLNGIQYGRHILLRTFR